MQVMAVLPPNASWQEVERIFISSPLANLTNMTSGGDGIDPEVVAQAQAGTYIVTYPDGHEETITNLSQFCRDHGLHNALAVKVAKGKRGHTGGYKFRYPDEDPRPIVPKYKVMYANGDIEYTTSLRPWARENGYNPQSIAAVACGQKKSYRGIRIQRLIERRKEELCPRL